ncbi:dimethylsulfonioproprionate lyase family protein [Inquilinus limosus]|uniref:dimethylsulfonioproprionate lyase family protein n=1 Tax=Inquilinus limosus TaxID=171674 RepID=UPI00068D9729|nr:dimethylsulfonioproprionate lyase family protein [Inquilinus limosus]
MSAAGPDRLIGTARALLDGLDRPKLRPFLADWPVPDAARRSVEPRPLPVLRWLDRLATDTAGETRPLVDGIVAAAAELAWGQTYAAADFGERFLERYGWSELIGLRGPIAGDRLACGVLLLGPDLEYPAHSHAAEEIYLPLAGTALWLRGEEGWRPRRPSELIHHPSGIAHAMRTGGQPLLALYLWRGGDLAQKSTILGAAGGRKEGGSHDHT